MWPTEPQDVAVPAQTRDPLAIHLLTVAEVAGVLRVSNMTVYRLIKGGALPAVRVGKNFRIREQDLSDYLAAGATVADAPSNG